MDFKHRRVELDDVRAIELGLIFLESFKDVVLDFIDEGQHAVFDLEPVDGVINFFTVEPEEFHAAVIVNELEDGEVVTTDTLESLHFVHDDISQFWVFDLVPDVLGDCNVVVVLDILFEEFALRRGVVGVGEFLHIEGQVLDFVHQSQHLLLVLLVKRCQVLYFLVLLFIDSIYHQAIAVLGKQ